VDANLELGLPADAREYSTGSQILAALGIRSVRLLTNNPAKVRGLSGFGVEVTGRVALPVIATPDNLRYLIAKRDRLGHQIEGLPLPADPAARAARVAPHPARVLGTTGAAAPPGQRQPAPAAAVPGQQGGARAAEHPVRPVPFHARDTDAEPAGLGRGEP
jgi:hypothetical protein